MQPKRDTGNAVATDLARARLGREEGGGGGGEILEVAVIGEEGGFFFGGGGGGTGTLLDGVDMAVGEGLYAYREARHGRPRCNAC